MSLHSKNTTESSIKVLIATGLFPPDIGGPATYSALLTKELPSHGFNVGVLSYGLVRRFPKGISHVIYFLILFARAFRHDVIFAQDPVSVGLPAAFVCKLLNKRFILKVVGDYAWEQGVSRYGITSSLDEFLEDDNLPRGVVLLRKAQTYVAKNADRLIVPSKYLKRVVYTWGIDRKKIFIVYNSHQNLAIRQEKNFLRQALKVKGELLISVGRLVKWKGFGVLIELLPKLLETFPDLKLVIVGRGPEKKRLEKLIRRHNLSETNIVLTGGLPQDIVHNYIKASDLFVLNTGYEGFSHQLLEVMSLGVPVVTTRIGGNPEIIEHGKDGLLVEYNNKKEIEKSIIKLLKDKSLSAHLTQNARKKVEKFNKENMIKSTAKLLS